MSLNSTVFIRVYSHRIAQIKIGRNLQYISFIEEIKDRVTKKNHNSSDFAS